MAFGGKMVRSSFKLFKIVDGDGTGNIDYEEVKALVRGELGLSRDKVPSKVLKRLWATLDADGSTRVSVEEFAAFMRLGAAGRRG